METNTSKFTSFDWVEALAILGSAGGAIAGAMMQNVAIAAVPLSLTAAINLANRKSAMNAMLNQQQAAIAHVTEQQQVAVDQLNQQHQSAMSHWTEQYKTHQSTLDVLAKQIAENHRFSQDEMSQLQAKDQEMLQAQQQTAQRVQWLQDISKANHAISSKLNVAQSYVDRGLTYEQMGNLEGAIADFSEAIRVNAEFAVAYYHRGLVQAKLDQKQAALKDLRMASKLYFTAGDLESYQDARDIAQELHAQAGESEEQPAGMPSEELLPVASLFS
jgi:tetratricopeptide (TPR) repeat protein